MIFDISSCAAHDKSSKQQIFAGALLPYYQYVECFFSRIMPGNKFRWMTHFYFIFADNTFWSYSGIKIAPYFGCFVWLVIRKAQMYLLLYILISISRRLPY